MTNGSLVSILLESSNRGVFWHPSETLKDLLFVRRIQPEVSMPSERKQDTIWRVRIEAFRLGLRTSRRWSVSEWQLTRQRWCLSLFHLLALRLHLWSRHWNPVAPAGHWRLYRLHLRRTRNRMLR